jgi:hypothetical protein
MITCMLPLEVQTTSMAFGCTMGEAIAILNVSMNHARTRRVSDRELRSACMVAHYEASDEGRDLSISRCFATSTICDSRKRPQWLATADRAAFE